MTGDDVDDVASVTSSGRARCLRSCRDSSTRRVDVVVDVSATHVASHRPLSTASAHPDPPSVSTRSPLALPPPLPSARPQARRQEMKWGCFFVKKWTFPHPHNETKLIELCFVALIYDSNQLFTINDLHS